MIMPGCCSAGSATARHFNDEKARQELAAYQRSGPGQTTRRLLAGLRGAGASGTLLDVGAGIGALSLELLKAGMTTATCVDVAPAALAVGEAEARRQGLDRRMEWHEGDFVELAPGLPAADVVTLDRVVCCYPAYRPLLEEAAARSRELLGLSYPRDRWYVRLILRLENLWRRVTGNAFRAFVHPVAEMDQLLQRAGFTPVYHETTLAWATSVYARRDRPTG